MVGGTSAAPARARPGSTEIWSSRSRMTPSRSAHGQISRAGRSKMSMHASATSAPGTIWWVRLGETPGSAASSSGESSISLGIQVDSVSSSSTRGTSGPSPLGAAPQIRASDRKVFDVAAARSGTPGRSRWPASRAISARICLRSSRMSASEGRPPPNHRRAIRAAPSGRDHATSGASSVPAAISSDPPPMSKTARRPADQPNQRRTARKVSRASSSPESTSSDTPVSGLDVGEDLVGVDGVAHRGGGEAEHLLAALVVGDPRRLGTEVGEGVDALLGDRPVGVEVLGQPQRLLV